MPRIVVPPLTRLAIVAASIVSGGWMKAVVREIASAVIGLTGIVLMGIGFNQILDIGSCASGGPYEITRPCPEGSDVLFWLAAAGSIMWIVGIVVSKEGFIAPGAGQFLWTAGFAGGGAAMLVKVLNQPEMPPDARLGASIVAALFIPMGLVVGVIGVVQLVRQRRGGGRPPRREKAKPKVVGNDPASRTKALNDLRSTGALTRQQFNELRADTAGVEPKAVDRIALIQKLADKWVSGALTKGEFEARKRTVIFGEQTDSPRQ
jgi:hypothetical protein